MAALIGFSQFPTGPTSPTSASMISTVLLAMLGCAAGERTVVVTPRPRWLVKEPRVDPSSPSVPSILPARVPIFSLSVIPHSSVSASLPMEHRGKPPELSMETIPVHRLATVLRKPVLMAPGQGHVLTSPLGKPFMRPIVVLQPGLGHPSPFGYRGGFQPQPFRPTVFVESVPSLSVKLSGDDQTQFDGPADYLTPPKYPSVYETMDVKSEPLNQKQEFDEDDTSSVENSIDDTSNEIDDPPPSDIKKQKHIGERIEFQLHGQAGPESYKFGFDTGAGKNRQFRYEEKDAVGNVKGHFGYYDTTGKLQFFNYHADETGFHAEQVN